MEQKSETQHHPNDLLRFIVRYKRACDGNSPSYRDIMRACRLASSSMVHRYLRKLEREGHIRLVSNTCTATHAGRCKCRRVRAIVVVGGTWVAPTGERKRLRS